MSNRLVFVQHLAVNHKTSVWDVLNGGTKLGEIRWYAPWRRYCFFPASNMLFDRSCMAEIIGMIDNQMQEREMQRLEKNG